MSPDSMQWEGNKVSSWDNLNLILRQHHMNPNWENFLKYNWTVIFKNLSHKRQTEELFQIKDKETWQLNKCRTSSCRINWKVWGAWMVQSVEHLTVGFGSGRGLGVVVLGCGLGVMRLSPAWGSALSAEFCLRLSLPLPLPPLYNK